MLKSLRSFGLAILPQAAAIAVTMFLGFVLVAAIADEPLLAYRELLFANFDSRSNFALFINRATPIALIAVGIVFAFRAGVFNVGGEGQLYLGAMAATVVALFLSDLPGAMLLPLCLLGGILAGGIWGWIPAVLKVRLAVDEVVSTLMLNFVALLFTSYLVNHPLRDPEAYGALSRKVPESVWLPSIPGLPNASMGFVAAVILAIISWIVLFRTSWGAEVRAAGTNIRFAEAIGTPGGRRVIEAMFVAGAFAGLAGALYVLGIGHRFEQNFSPAYGLVALTVALLARVHPIGALLTSLYYALMLNGAAYMQIATDVPRSLVVLLTGLLVLFMTVRLRPPRVVG
ncbi:MAG: ABC transporter permease [Rhodobacteraceae bacterium]|nr:ABC transporter permease [Paracoccaceae bacterium]